MRGAQSLEQRGCVGERAIADFLQPTFSRSTTLKQCCFRARQHCLMRISKYPIILPVRRFWSTHITSRDTYLCTQRRYLGAKPDRPTRNLRLMPAGLGDGGPNGMPARRELLGSQRPTPRHIHVHLAASRESSIGRGAKRHWFPLPTRGTPPTESAHLIRVIHRCHIILMWYQSVQCFHEHIMMM
jgi:hypothetical protein